MTFKLQTVLTYSSNVFERNRYKRILERETETVKRRVCLDDYIAQQRPKQTFSFLLQIFCK